MTLPVVLFPRTNQQAFDVACKHLLSMTHQSKMITDKGIPYCCYRTNDGNRCVIGAMITDEDYDPEIDNHAYQDSSGIEFLHLHNKVEVNDIELMLLIELQRIHDDAKSWGPDGFTNIGALRTLARTYSLSSSIIDALFENIRK